MMESANYQETDIKLQELEVILTDIEKDHREAAIWLLLGQQGMLNKAVEIYQELEPGTPCASRGVQTIAEMMV